MEEILEVVQITAVEKQKKNRHRYNIYLNDQFAFSVHEDMLVKYRLLKGEYVNTQTIETIIVADENHKAYMEALRFIGRRPRSRKEVIYKLQEKGYSEDAINHAVHKLTELKAIDDEQFAALWTEHRLFSQNKGRRWVQQELKQKGLSKEHIAEALANVDEESEYKAAYETAKKKWQSLHGEPYEKNRKLASFMLRRGYSNQIVGMVLKQLTGDSLEELDSL